MSLELLPANCRGLGASVDLAWQMMITDDLMCMEQIQDMHSTIILHIHPVQTYIHAICIPHLLPLRCNFLCSLPFLGLENMWKKINFCRFLVETFPKTELHTQNEPRAAETSRPKQTWPWRPWWKADNCLLFTRLAGSFADTYMYISGHPVEVYKSILTHVCICISIHLVLKISYLRLHEICTSQGSLHLFCKGFQALEAPLVHPKKR